MPKHHDVNVSLANGEVKFQPHDGNVITTIGNDTIILKRANNFVFTSIGFDDPEPFVWSVQDDQIVVIDRNRNESGKTKEYKYVVSVQEKSSGTVHTSEDPLISN